MALEKFTTVAFVKDEAGVEDNTNIGEADVQPKVDSANGMVNASIGLRYILPLEMNNDYYTDSQAKDLLQDIATRLGAGLLLMKLYEGTGGDLEETGKKKFGEAKGDLRLIKKGDVSLIGTDGNPFVLLTSGKMGLKGKPTDTTQPYFTMGKEY